MAFASVCAAAAAVCRCCCCVQAAAAWPHLILLLLAGLLQPVCRYCRFLQVHVVGMVLLLNR